MKRVPGSGNVLKPAGKEGNRNIPGGTSSPLWLESREGSARAETGVWAGAGSR